MEPFKISSPLGHETAVCGHANKRDRIWIGRVTRKPVRCLCCNDKIKCINWSRKDALNLLKLVKRDLPIIMKQLCNYRVVTGAYAGVGLIVQWNVPNCVVSGRPQSWCHTNIFSPSMWVGFWLTSVLTAAVYLAFTCVVRPFVVFVLIHLVCVVLSGNIMVPDKANHMEFELSLIQVNVYGNTRWIIACHKINLTHIKQ